jgi:two-component sensor histidine kinase
MFCRTCYSCDAVKQWFVAKIRGSPKRGSRKSYVIFKRLGFVRGLSFVLMQANRRALAGAVQLQSHLDSQICEARQQVTAADKPLRVSLNFLCSPKVAVVGSALLMLLIGWIDYVTDFNVTVFYFVPVVLATWRAGRKAGWFIAILCGATVLIADLMVPRSGRAIALSYINAGILVLASAALAELVISSHRAHERLKALLALKTVSLTEIHHRVKNNLQIVSSLLRLQSGKFADPAVRDVFTECRDRINAMARLHEQLYDEAGRSHLDFAPHLRELGDMLARSHTPPGCKLALNVSADRVPLDLDQSILLSLIANELLLNALKHAFHGRAAGKIDAELRTTRDRVMLAIRDDGNGIVPHRTEIGDQRGTGMDLVQAMSRQLGGEFAVNRMPAGGTCATISFPNKMSRQQTGTHLQL